MNVLVTGGAGFIGRQLVPLLLGQGHSVMVMDCLTATVHGEHPVLPEFLTRDCRFARSDIRDPQAWQFLAAERPDVVVHLAAETGVGQSMYEVGRYTDVNIQGTAVMLDALREFGGTGRIVLASSRAVYGEGSYDCETCGVVTPAPRSSERLSAGLWEPTCPTCGRDIAGIETREDAPRAPTSIYAMTKSAQEDLIGIAAPTLGASAAILRYANVYGEGQPLTNPYTGVLSAFALRLMKGGAPEVYEDGLATRDFVHVLDIAKATLVAAEGLKDVTVNIGSGERWTLLDIARELSCVFGCEPSRVQVTGKYRIGDIRGYLADISGLQEALGFQAGVPLSEGLRRFGSWVRSDASIPEQDVASLAERELVERGLLGGVSHRD
jgi:dTDP-L-rhamnose 4-epimerase